MYLEYTYLLKHLFICFIFVLLLFWLPILFVYQQPETEKFTSYECGFNPFNDTRYKFEVKFYLIGVLFLIFDIEISFLLPFIISASMIGIQGWLIMLFFVMILTVGFWYEWIKGAIEFAN